jgi:hypothetical protein
MQQICFTLEPTSSKEGVMVVAGSDEHGVVLRLTTGEVGALDAVRRGVGVLAERGLDRESAVIAALGGRRGRAATRA